MDTAAWRLCWFLHLRFVQLHMAFLHAVEDWHRSSAKSTWSFLLQKLAENDDDDYTNSAWANPKALKHHFSGVGSVRIR